MSKTMSQKELLEKFKILSERFPHVALKCIPLNENEGVFDELKECSEIKKIQHYFETADTKQKKAILHQMYFMCIEINVEDFSPKKMKILVIDCDLLSNFSDLNTDFSNELLQLIVRLPLE